MANEPEREIEKTLKACAEQRRAEAGAPRELHPATRRLLQAEVARTHARAGSGAGFWSQFLRTYRLQLAVGFSAMLVLGVGAFLFLENPAKQNRAPQLLAKMSESRATTDRNGIAQNKPTPVPPSGAAYNREVPAPVPSASVPPPAPAPVAPRKSPETLTFNSSSYKEVDKQKAPPTAVLRMRAESSEVKTANVVSSDLSLADSVGKTEVGARDGGVNFATNSVATSSLGLGKDLQPITGGSKLGFADVPATPPPATVVAADDPARTRSVWEDAASGRGGSLANFATKKFARVPLTGAGGATFGGLSPNGNTNGDKSVLNAFQVETIGDQIRIVDSDGSVYTGNWQSQAIRAGEESWLATATPSPSQTEDLKSRRAPPAEKSRSQTDEVKVVNGALAAPNYIFHVRGTNLTLNQPVLFVGTFAGNYAPAPGVRPAAPAHVTALPSASTPPLASVAAPKPVPVDSLTTSPTSVSGIAGESGKISTGPTPLRLLNLSISGTAMIGTNQIGVSAKAVDAR